MSNIIYAFNKIYEIVPVLKTCEKLKTRMYTWLLLNSDTYTQTHTQAKQDNTKHLLMIPMHSYLKALRERI
jgi:hypothetical protein